MGEMINDYMAVMLWQTDSSHHPLTCGNIECDGRLLPSLKDGCVILKCPDCSYEQKNIPIPVIQSYYELVNGHVFREDILKTIKNITSKRDF